MKVRMPGKVVFLAISVMVLGLTGCSTVSLDKSASASSRSGLPAAGSGRGGYYMDDGPGDNPPAGLENLPDAQPRIEEYRKATLRPYEVFGKTYTPIADDSPLQQRGIGSWYGKKFHGQKTASGEIYDMYKMTAAHPTLPIPSYVRVTNLKNGKQVVVRVNDRGPFHSNRIIDLSYAAARKLDYLQAGSAELQVERITQQEIRNNMAAGQGSGVIIDSADLGGNAMQVQEIAPLAPAVAPAPVITTAAAPVQGMGGFQLQFGAFSSGENASKLRATLQEKLSGMVSSVEVIEVNGKFRVLSRGYDTRDAAQAVVKTIQDRGLASPYIVEQK